VKPKALHDYALAKPGAWPDQPPGDGVARQESLRRPETDRTAEPVSGNQPGLPAEVTP
jgi:hypothetical protein